MAKGLYRLKKPEVKHSANQVPGRHEIRRKGPNGEAIWVTHEEPQEFDPVAEGVAQYCEPVEAPAKGKAAPKPGEPAKAADQ